MKTWFLPVGRTNRRLLAPIFALTVVLLLGPGLLVAACGGSETATTVAGATLATQTVTTDAAAITTQAVITTQRVTTTQAVTTTTAAPVPMSKAEIGQWKTDATALADRFYGAFPDADAMLANFADDATFYDPCSGSHVWFLKGKQSIVGMMQDFNDMYPSGKYGLKAVFLSGDGAAYRLAMENMWPPFSPEPAARPPWIGLEVFHVKDGQGASWDIWNSPPSLELGTYGVFASGKGGSAQLREIADRYLTAWSSGDKTRIAALYHPDAVFSDTMLGLQAQGAAAIAELGEKRFGAGGPVTFEVLDLYAQTYGYAAPTEQQPEQGAIIGVGIHYRGNLVVDGKPATVEGLTTFELGTREYMSALDPNGLIHREEVFYDADSLLASGLAD
jgi:ketosteroid isomerase-like protein